MKWNLLKKAVNSEQCAPTDSVIDELIKALSEDLETPKVLSILNQWSAETLSGKTGGSSVDLREVLDALLGLNF